MKTYKISILSLLLALLFLAGCSDRKKFFEDERYEKMVYIVSDNNNIHNLVYDLDGKDGNIRNLSIACSGTNPTEEPVTISLTEDTVLLMNITIRTLSKIIADMPSRWTRKTMR